MKVALIGANGQLGSDLTLAMEDANIESIPVNHSDVAIEDHEGLKKVLKDIKPEIVINTSAYHNVPKCEENPDISFDVNAVGAYNLAKLSNELAFKVLHYSTDYVFNGEKKAPYVESDAPDPLNTYAISKLAGEQFLKHYSDSAFVVRISGIYGKVPCRAKGGNFIHTMNRLNKEKPEVKVVDDEVLTPTPTKVIAHNTLKLIETEHFGLYHMTCEGSCSWYEFAKVIFETLGFETPLYSCSVSDFPSNVKRPFYSVLENQELKINGINEMPHWKDALVDFLKNDFQG